jgi:hypothetical protein
MLLHENHRDRYHDLNRRRDGKLGSETNRDFKGRGSNNKKLVNLRNSSLNEWF